MYVRDIRPKYSMFFGRAALSAAFCTLYKFVWDIRSSLSENIRVSFDKYLLVNLLKFELSVFD